MTPEPRDTSGCLLVFAAFLLLVAPVYLMFRYLLGLARAAHGFGVTPEEAAEAPLRICTQCHNTVLENDFQHCPYCGAPLPPAPAAGPTREGSA